MKTQEEKEVVLALRAKNYSIKRISEETKLAKDTITNILRDNREEVNSLLSIEMDVLLKEKALTKEARITSFSQALSSIEEELSKRSLSDVPTIQLFKMYLDTQKAIKEEIDGLGLYSPQEAKNDRNTREVESSLTGWG